MPLGPEEGRVHWRAPLVIVCSYVIATILAAAHHILYHFLEGTKVNERVVTQQTILASGTALAFLFRACLLVGLGVTYCQVFWWSIRRSPLELSSLDSLGCDSRLTHHSDDWCLYDPSEPATAHNRIIYAYLSWLPSKGQVVPFGEGNVMNARLPLEAMPFGSYKGGPASTFVANRARFDADEWNVPNCSFYNASFLANFSSDASKRVTPVIKDLEILNPISASIADPGWSEDTHLDPKHAVIFSYMSLMQCLCKILYGTIVSPVASEIPLINEGKVQQPDVLITGLGLSQELMQMRKSSLKSPRANDSNWIFPAEQPTYPPDTKEADRFSEAWPTSDFYSPVFGRPLASSIEEMFHSMTLSLFSSLSFLIKSDVPVNAAIPEHLYLLFYQARRIIRHRTCPGSHFFDMRAFGDSPQRRQLQQQNLDLPARRRAARSLQPHPA